MDRARPGYYMLIQAGIANEGEAERLARGTSGESTPPNYRRVIRVWPSETATEWTSPDASTVVAG